MESFAFVFPVLPEKAEQARAFGKEVSGPRSSEMDASRRPLGVRSGLGGTDADG